MRWAVCLPLLAAALTVTYRAAAQTEAPGGSVFRQLDPQSTCAIERRPQKAVAPPAWFTSTHEALIRGKVVRYKTEAGETHLTDSAGRPVGSLFSFSYLKEGPILPARPVMFVFNGGPGSSSLWLHVGAVGPERIVLDQEINPSNTPPFGLANNPYSPLDVADLVFIDPIGTGFSQAIGSGENQDFYGVDEDANSIAQFIELWLSRHHRWTAPKYLMGESYGSIRATVLTRALLGGPLYTGVMRGITLHGVILLGTIIGPSRAATQSPKGYGPEMSAALRLPALADTAWYHGKIQRTETTLEAFDRDVTHFAMTDYLEAISKAKYGTLTSEARATVLARLTEYTGLPKEAFPEDLKFDLLSLANRLLAGEKLSLGAYDSRYTLQSQPTLDDPVADDPAMTRYVPGFIAAFHVLLDHLEVDWDRPYAAINWRSVEDCWNWKRHATPSQLTFAQELALSMRRIPQLRVLILAGYFDLVTTAAEARYQVEIAGLPADRTQMKVYPSGHMVYLGGTSRLFSDDVRHFILGDH